jgi:hypothetical protein
LRIVSRDPLHASGLARDDCLAVFITCSAWYLNVMAVYADTDTYLVNRTILELLTPWSYGGLGLRLSLALGAYPHPSAILRRAA